MEEANYLQICSYILINRKTPIKIDFMDQTHPAYKKIQDYVFGFSDRVGKGNFSHVYQGVHQPSQKPVAIKVVELSSLNNPHLQELLKTQTSILRKLDHPNVIKCEEILSSARNCYIITELCSDGNLQQKLKINGPYEEYQLYPIIRDVFAGLAYLSKNSIVHRDIKISNVLINKGVYKIADFGFAKVSKFDFKDISIGSPIYMSPEGYIDNVYGPKTDVWSFGILIMELLTGKPPFYFCQNENQLKQHLLSEILIDKFCPQISRQLKEMLRACLEIDPRKRVSMEELSQTKWIQTHITKIQQDKEKKNPKVRERKTSFMNRMISPEKPFLQFYDNLEQNRSLELFKKTLKENEKKFNSRKQNQNSFENRINKNYHIDDFKSISPPFSLKTELANKTSQRSNKLLKPQSCKQKKNMSQNLENKQKTKSYLAFQSPGKNLSLFFEKGIKPYDRNFGQKLIKKPTIYEHKKELIKIINKRLSFSESISIIHYCRLCYKYGCLISDQPIIDAHARTFFMSWSVQILMELNDKIQKSQIAFGREETLMKNFSLNIEDQNKNQEKKKKLKDVIEEYINKYTTKVKGKKDQIFLDCALSYIKDHFNKGLMSYKQSKEDGVLPASQCALYAYLFTVEQESIKFGQFCRNKRTSLENRSLEKLLGLKIQSFNLQLVESMSKNLKNQ